MDMAHHYSPPAAHLLTLGRPSNSFERSDYPGLGPENIPELIGIATDLVLRNSESEGPEVWAPVHAWRALGRLGPAAAAAGEPLVDLLGQAEGDDEWMLEDLPTVLGSLGPSVVDPLTRLLGDPSRGATSRIVSTKALAELGRLYPEARGDCIAALTAELERRELGNGQGDVNGFVVSALIRLKAVEAVPVLERAFGEDIVPQGICGDWEAVQVGLGLKEPLPSSRTRPSPGVGFTPPPEPEIVRGGFRDPRAVRQRTAAERRKKKLAKASRRKNRR
jgi:hypothetical protein